MNGSLRVKAHATSDCQNRITKNFKRIINPLLSSVAIYTPWKTQKTFRKPLGCLLLFSGAIDKQHRAEQA